MPTAGSDDPRSHGHTAARGALLAAAVADLATRVDGVFDGDHFFRQALVLANVEKVPANGILTVPESYNADLFLPRTGALRRVVQRRELRGAGRDGLVADSTARRFGTRGHSGAWSDGARADLLGASLVTRTEALRATGAMIARLTAARDFVLYGTASGDANPAFLYFAHRDGANVIAGVDSTVLRQRFLALAEARGGRLVLFVPASHSEVAAARRREPGWREVAAEAAGWVFVAG